ncbi:Asp-tRNA(Asn)/Glu-tRNA(Gln) amidotransferase subunit GatB [candidate division NPL-UPA2 bacterium Unc8]|uniref:Aspartyl/glutamyl-tRNA(Asn/Gln) amidotransferase subunit B n=1 Tax=candidate division NPL-UPA2 bacterium Unc8 TaxID=1980939 RepID=A0A399FXA0_UNCN2|nr:Aspartyl/glutamyl-tRNA(Asn/Gln) amidotransferase subunit B [Bacillota bacterium]MBT9146747.1 Aspartyl/glutamyl-tRNA(Asn/Gln) amidotransferase subunit B [Bacillota bacterium]RII01048.1 MAG: Asp-tRNA(Asn)/Glu-tRNA(Gln) amidotransferase subunit GatB [candidate division NPL-UPA2 bacterium Unc8]
MYQTVIGLEVHAELSLDTKIFCGCSTKFGQEPNSQTCPICLGLPGALPVLNEEAVKYIIKIGLALGCRILPEARFDRKNYYYPDLPKNYQISQNYLPFAVDGYLELPPSQKKGTPIKVGIDNVHLEEDTGKNIHSESGGREGYSLVDFNRAGIPLVEIVTRPDMHSLEDTESFMVSLRNILLYLGVSNCKMEEGALRFEASVSIRPDEASSLNARVEIKNLNSFKSVLRSLQYEIERQRRLLSGGEIVSGETRLWDEKEGKTLTMRVKESSPDYRYFPEPDLPPVVIKPQWIKTIRAAMPELPAERLRRFVKKYHLPPYDAIILTSSKSLADFYEEVVEGFPDGKHVSNWIMGEVLEKLKERKIGIEESSLTPASLSELLNLIKCGTISGKMAREVFAEMFATGKGAGEIVKERGLAQISDTRKIKETIDLILKKNPAAISDFQTGKKKVIAYLTGQVMKETKGAANPQLVNELLQEALQQQ